MKAVVVYRSHSGVTRSYGEAIAEHLRGRGLETVVASVGDASYADVAAADFLFLGCWTSGLFVVMQHPDEPWLAFVRDMPESRRPKVALFTTYKLATGTQFPRMRAALAGKTNAPELELRSRNGGLSDADRAALNRFVG